MGFKTWITLLAILSFISIGYAVYMKITGPTETYRAGLQNYFTFEPKQTFGCANYNIPKDFNIKSETSRGTRQRVKTEARK